MSKSLRNRRRAVRKPQNAGPPPEAELEILAVLGRGGEMEARSIVSALAPIRRLAHSSVVTLLGRLEAKQLVVHRPAPAGKAFLYRAKDPGSLFAGVLSRLAARIFGGDRPSLVSTLFRGAPPTAEEIERLQQLVSELDERRR